MPLLKTNSALMHPHLGLRLTNDAPEVRRGAVNGPHALDQRPDADDERGDAKQYHLPATSTPMLRCQAVMR